MPKNERKKAQKREVIKYEFQYYHVINYVSSTMLVLLLLLLWSALYTHTQAIFSLLLVLSFVCVFFPKTIFFYFHILRLCVGSEIDLWFIRWRLFQHSKYTKNSSKKKIVCLRSKWCSAINYILRVTDGIFMKNALFSCSIYNSFTHSHHLIIDYVAVFTHFALHFLEKKRSLFLLNQN